MALDDRDFNQNKNSQPNSSSEQEKDLKRLSEQLNKNDDNDDRRGAIGVWFKRIAIIFLVLLLLGGVAVAIYFFSQNKGDLMGGAQIKLSTQLTENLDPESGSMMDQSIYYKEIYPGNKFPVSVAVRNSDNFSGDIDETGTSIYVRYKIALFVDGVEYHDVILPSLSDIEAENWHIYNPEEEVESYKWDGFYYHYGALKPQQSLSLFNEIQFSFEKTTNSFGGKRAEIVVTIEAIQADIANIGTDEANAWNTAPRRWINNMKNKRNNNGGAINI